MQDILLWVLVLALVCRQSISYRFEWEDISGTQIREQQMTIIPLVRDGGKESGYIIFKAEKMNISCFCLVSFIPTVTYKCKCEFSSNSSSQY